MEEKEIYIKSSQPRLARHFKSLAKWAFIYVFLVVIASLSVTLDRVEIGGYSREDIAIAFRNLPALAFMAVIVWVECAFLKNGPGKIGIINCSVILFFLFVVILLIYSRIAYEGDFYYWTYGMVVELVACIHILSKNLFFKNRLE